MAVESSARGAAGGDADRIIIAADWVITSTSPPIRDGAVLIDGSTIGWIGSFAEAPMHLGDVPIERRRGVLCPGLVNSHTHLQFTNFAELGRERYVSFEEWSIAFEAMYREVSDPQVWHSSALQGVQQAIRSGTTVFADVISDHEARGALESCGVTGIEYIEVVGGTERVWRDGARERFLAELSRPAASELGRARVATVQLGVSPHAPYSVDGSVVRELVAIAADRDVRVHSHVAESSVEEHLYMHGDREVLEPFGDLGDEFSLVRLGGAGLQTAAYADSVRLLNSNTHLAHTIYLDRAGRDLLRQRRTQVALCPRSNEVIGLDQAPVAAYLSEGHEISVGTDSLASSPSLDLMADVAALARNAYSQGYNDVDLHDRLVRAATVGGARALGLEHLGYGTLAIGGPADLAVFDVPIGLAGPAAALVMYGTGNCTLTIAAGKRLHDASWTATEGRPRGIGEL